MPTTEFETLLYSAAGPVATTTRNRPDQLNTIVPPVPDEIGAAVGIAERDPVVEVIVLRSIRSAWRRPSGFADRPAANRCASRRAFSTA